MYIEERRKKHSKDRKEKKLKLDQRCLYKINTSHTSLARYIVRFFLFYHIAKQVTRLRSSASMAVGRPLGCIVAGVLTIVAGIILIIGAIIMAKETNYLRAHWTQIYGLAIFSAVISVLAIIGAVSLLYVVSRQFPALTTLFSGFLIFVAFLAVICLTILLTARSDLQRKTYEKTQKLFGNYSNVNATKDVKPIVDYIQQSYECCGVNQAADWEDKFPVPNSTPDSCCRRVIVGCG